MRKRIQTFGLYCIYKNTYILYIFFQFIDYITINIITIIV